MRHHITTLDAPPNRPFITNVPLDVPDLPPRVIESICVSTDGPTQFVRVQTNSIAPDWRNRVDTFLLPREQLLPLFAALAVAAKDNDG